MSGAECYICGQEIPKDVPYYCIERIVYRKLDGSCWNDEIQSTPMPTAVLVACESCTARLSAGLISHSGEPYELLIIEEERLAECLDDLSHGREVIPEAQSCSICEKDIEVGSTYMRIHLCSEVMCENGSVKPLGVTTIAIMCDKCAEIARRHIG